MNEELENTFADMAEYCRRSERRLKRVLWFLGTWIVISGGILLYDVLT